MAAATRTSCAGQPFRGPNCAWLRHYCTICSAPSLPLCQALCSTMNKILSSIIVIGILYTLGLYILIGEGVQVFGLTAFLGTLSTYWLWKKSKLCFKDFMIDHVLSALTTIMALIVSGKMMLSKGPEATIMFCIIVPSFTLGFAWLVLISNLTGKLLSLRKRT